jgi:two-component system, OmpR family, phosphate regulon sensor histidine kinase PhoR
MTTPNKKILFATLAVVVFFAFYETVKTLLFPRMDVVTSHVITIIVVGIITVFIARYVFRQQGYLLREREETNERLREALSKSGHDENLLRSIVASVAEGLVITGRDSNVLLINDAARALLDLGQRPVVRLTNISRDPQVHRAFAHTLNTGERSAARLELRGQGQERRVLQLHAAPLRLHDGQPDDVDGVVGAFIDISQLEKLERVRQEFLSNVSHELRTPLSVITAYTETLLDGGLDDRDNSLRFLNTIQRNVERMRALVNDISELSAIESGAVRLRPEQLPLRQVTNDICAGLSLRAAQCGVLLANEVPEGFYVHADHRRLEQILINLVDNAIKFNYPGGRITIAAESDGQHQLIKVCDTGQGIPPEHLPRVFERFYRVDKARSREVSGTGLGLAIVKHLARAHGGEAYVTSEVGAGSEFIIKLPPGAAPRANIEPIVETASYAAKF